MNKDKNIFEELSKTENENNNENDSEKELDVKKEEKEELEGQLIVDIYQKENEIIIQSLIAGVNPDDLEINISPESVTIKGERKKTEIIDEKDYFFQECFWGKFSRTIILPQEIDTEKTKASFKNGILTIKMPKLHIQKEKNVKIKIE